MTVSIVSGGAGFIGVNLLRFLLEEGRTVVVLDNMTRGSENLIHQIYGNHKNQLHVFRCECSSADDMKSAFKRCTGLGQIEEVWHLAANSDIPAGISDASIDLKDTFLTTYELVRAMREFNVPNLHFASSSAIYGDLGDIPLREDIGPLLPISNYGAMKLASEAILSAAAESHLKRVNIFRFPNVVGFPATHGVILDFINKLVAKQNELHVLGNGSQKKSYLHVSDLIGALLTVRGRGDEKKIELINIGPIDSGVTVEWIAQQVVSRISPGAKIVFGEGDKGWVGDVPKFNYSTKRLQSYGWAPELNSEGAVIRAIDEIARQCGL